MEYDFLAPLVLPILHAECGCRVSPGQVLFYFGDDLMCFDCLMGRLVDMGEESFAWEYGSTFGVIEADYENKRLEHEYI